MITKVFEVRDEATNIGVIATKMVGEVPDEDYELERNGFTSSNNLVLVTQLSNSKSSWDAFDWQNGTRTMFEAHKYIEEHFDELRSGDVIDVRFILGEVNKPCKSDKFYSTLFTNEGEKTFIDKE